MKEEEEKQKISFQTLKGMHDILPENYLYYQNFYDKAEEIADYYGFKPIQTPILEKMDLFTASIGETSDIIEKQMYTLKTKGGDHLALRPEGTAPVMRSYLEHGMFTLPQPIMLWYEGSFFRHENPQKGRLREFQQFGLEIIGESKPIAEVTVIRVLTLILEEIGIKSYTVHINSLGDKDCKNIYRKELLVYYKKKLNNLCKDCKRRFKENPLRLLDCKEEKCIEMKKDAPQMISYLCEACKNHLKETLEFLDASEIPYLLDNYLVRGIDYYSRTVFEIFTEERNGLDQNEEMQKIALSSGGRYDTLAKTIGKRDFPAAGGAIGIDRAMQVLKNKNVHIRSKRSPKVFFIQIGPAAKYKSIMLIEMFRKAHLPVSQSISKENIRGQLRIASKLNIQYALILGQKEVLDNTIIIKDMNTMEQETVSISKVIDVIKNKLK